MNDFNIFKNILLKYRGNDDYVIVPEGVTKIDDFAFSHNIAIAVVILPDSVTEIGRGAFAGCKNLLNVRIPDSVTVIGEDAFAGCRALARIPDLNHPETKV